MQMKKIKTRVSALMLSAVMAAGVLGTPVAVHADSVTEKTVLCLGADLNDSEKQTVLSLLGISSDELAQDQIVTVTNADEHTYLDSYLSAEVIGSRALSCAAVTRTDKGNGIQVSVQNISYCTPDMYENALATAGMTDADVSVAAPFSVSGTAALVGVMKAYSEITGEPLKAESLDAASDELVTTGKVAESVGDSEKASQLMTAVKAEVIGNDVKDADDIRQIIRDTATQLGLELSDEDVEAIVKLMQKLAGLNLDAGQIRDQLTGAYNKLKQQGFDLGISDAEAGSLIDKLSSWFASVLKTIQSWFN